MSRWESHYGPETAVRIAAAHLEAPPLDLSVASEAADWAKRLAAELLPWNSLRLWHKGRVEEIEGYQDGAWWVQDAAAALPALLLGGVEGMRVADLCAAPGGKTAQLAARGARVTAIDISSNRLRRVEENLARLRLGAEIITADATSFEPQAPFDAVLLDAPCSATGTIRRNPDIPYLKTNADIAALAEVQRRLLRHALNLVKPGGRVVYCTCSLEPEEGEAQIAALLKSSDNAAIDPIDGGEFALPPAALLPDGTLRTLPFHQPGEGGGGMDGFFAARLVRTS
jgi:16S rRNA (cytosine967-C5)-methyltransferase